MMTVFLQGFGLGGGSIIAIGSQNAFLFTQGLRRQHHFLVATICFISDALLIMAGVMGLGSLIVGSPVLLNVAFGAMLASCLWFYGLGIGAAKLAPVVTSPKAWKVIDGMICLIMWLIAIRLILL